MNKITKDFLEKIQRFTVKREVGETDYELMKKFHKERLSRCYEFLKLLTKLRDGMSYKLDYEMVDKITKKYEQEYLNWKKEYQL